MQRPPAIVRFERLYLLALATSVIGWWLAWDGMRRQLGANPALDDYGWLLPVFALVWVAIWLGLAWWIARGGDAGAKWLIVGLAAIGILRIVVNVPALLQNQVPALIAVQWVVTLGLVLAATAQLFRPEARAWLGEDGALEQEV